VTLTEGHVYSMQPYLRDTATGGMLRGPIRFFSVISDDGTMSLLTSNSTTTSQFFGFQGVLFQHVPFLWFAQIQASVASGTSATAGTIPTLVLDLSSSSLPMSLLLFSSSTMMQYVGTTTHSILYTLMQAAIWMSVLGLIYHQARNVFSHTDH